MQKNILDKTADRSLSTSMVNRFRTWIRKRFSKTHVDESLTAFRMYNDCTDLPLDNFIRCLCNDDYMALVIDGIPSVAQIQDKWLSVYSQFIELSHETDVMAMNSLKLQIIVLTARVAKIKTCVNTLIVLGGDWVFQSKNPEAVDLFNTCTEKLRKSGMRYKYEPSGSTYYTDLKMVLSRCTEWEIQLELRQAEADAINAKNSGEPVSPIYFTSWLVRMSEHFKFMIQTKSVYTAEFCLLKKDYLEYVSSVKNQNNKNAKH